MMYNPSMQSNCPKCGKEISGEFLFCPFCGFKKKSEITFISSFDIVKIILGSVFLSPLSLYWFFKYYKNPETKKIAFISLIITTVVFILGVITTVSYINTINNYFWVSEFK